MWDIVGHERAVEALSRALRRDQVAHSMLFTGPEGIGKTRLATELAKALNCTGEDPPCQACAHCRQIEAGGHPDVVVIERQEGKSTISIEQVRELRDAAVLRPFQGRRKVYMISGAEALTPQAADALLKTLEEPQPQLTLILTAGEDDALPGTVVSRCRTIRLQPVESSEIVSLLVRHGQEESEAERLARLARGSVGWALRAARQPELAAQQDELIDRVSRLLDLDLAARLQFVESLATDKKDRAAVRRALELLILLARDLLLIGQGIPPRVVDGAQRETLERQSARVTLDEVGNYLRSLKVAMDRIDQNVDPRLTLEALVVSAP